MTSCDNVPKNSYRSPNQPPVIICKCLPTIQKRFNGAGESDSTIKVR